MVIKFKKIRNCWLYAVLSLVSLNSCSCGGSKSDNQKVNLNILLTESIATKSIGKGEVKLSDYFHKLLQIPNTDNEVPFRPYTLKSTIYCLWNDKSYDLIPYPIGNGNIVFEKKPIDIRNNVIDQIIDGFKIDDDLRAGGKNTENEKLITNYTKFHNNDSLIFYSPTIANSNYSVSGKNYKLFSDIEDVKKEIIRLSSTTKNIALIILNSGISQNANPVVNGEQQNNNTENKCPAEGGLIHRLRSKDVGINIGMENESKPMFYFVNNSPKGFGYEFGQAIASRLGIKGGMHVVDAALVDLPKKLGAGEINMIIAGQAKTPDIPNVLWSKSYLENGLCLITRVGSGYSDYKQLSGKKVGIFNGDPSTKEWVKNNIPGVIIDDSHNETGWLTHLSNENEGWDAVIYDYIYAIAEIEPLNNLQIAEFNIKPIEYSIMVPCNNEDFIIEVNKAIDEIKESPEYDNLYKKYFAIKDKSKIRAVESTSKDCSLPDCYTVKGGETLGKISKNVLGDSRRYTEIFELNKDRIASPHLIYPGNKLRMPKSK